MTGGYFQPVATFNYHKEYLIWTCKILGHMTKKFKNRSVVEGCAESSMLALQLLFQTQWYWITKYTFVQAALEKEIAETLLAWKPHFDAVSRIFIAAPGSNELQIYKLAQPVFAKTDPRIAKVPFMTNRPTLSEAKRVATQLLGVYEPQIVEAPIKVSSSLYHSIFSLHRIDNALFCLQWNQRVSLYVFCHWNIKQ